MKVIGIVLIIFFTLCTVCALSGSSETEREAANDAYEKGRKEGIESVATPKVVVTPKATVPLTPKKKFILEKEFRDPYINGCLESGTKAQCDCTLDRIEENYTRAEFLDIVDEYSETNVFPPDFVQTVLVCF